MKKAILAVVAAASLSGCVGYGGYGTGISVGYGSSYGGYGGYGYNNANANIAFSCKVDYRGRITDIDFNRQSYGYNQYYRGY
mgnify:CR=1 FL=1